MVRRSFDFTTDSLTPALGIFDEATDRFLVATIGYHAPRAEAHAKRTAPWTDQTSNARNGLFATPQIDRPSYRIIVGHSVPYGLWLEVRWAGRYAVLEPTVRAEGAEVMKTISAGLMKSVAGGI